MELLLFWKDHWMDSLTPQQVADRVKENPKFQQKYDARFQRGDVVEVREDGYWDKRGFDKNAFCVVRVPGMALDADKMAALRDETTSDKPVFVKKRKWNVDEKKMAVAVKDSLDGADKKVTLTKTEVDTLFVERQREIARDG